MLEQNEATLRQSILRIYHGKLDDHTRQLISDETKIAQLILFSYFCDPNQGIDHTFLKLQWIMHNVPNGLAGAFMNLPQKIQSYDYLVALQRQDFTARITEAHAIVFKFFPDHMKTVETLQHLVKIQITLSHALAFKNAYTSNLMKDLEEVSKIAVSEHLDRIFTVFPSQEQTVKNLRSLSSMVVLEWHFSIFHRFPTDYQTIMGLKSILHLPSPPSYYLRVFSTFPLRERTPNTFNQLIALEFSEWQAIRFCKAIPQPIFGGKTFSEFKMMLPSPLNAFNAVFKEAILTTVIRKDVVPILKIGLESYNITYRYDEIVYDVAPIISKTIVIFTPAEIVTSFSGYVLRTGLPASLQESYKVGMLFMVSSFVSAVPKFNPIMKCLSIVNSLYLANSMVSEIKSIDSIFADIKNYSKDPISISSLTCSVSYYGFGLTISASCVWGIGAFIAATVVTEAFQYYYESQDPLQVEMLPGTTLPEFSNISYTN